MTLGRRGTAAAFLTPALFGILLVNIVPLLYSVYISLTNRNGPAHFAEGRYEVTGLQNYGRLLSDQDFYLVLGRTVLYAAVCVVLFFVVGLLFAVILNNPKIKGKIFWRTVLILPWAVPYWITALVWRFLFHGEYGPINQMLRLAGFSPPDWLLGPVTAFGVIVLVNVWLSFPFFMLVLLGGLQAIPDELYEAANMDGASWRQKFRAITLPLLRPVAIPAVILSIITTLKIFETVYLITGGGPNIRVGQPGATDVLLVWAYKQGFADTKLFGVVGAFSVIVFVVLVAITLFYARITRATKAAYD
jgi:arabinogalactan oligomer/maltooligosaccharide transport system permease protein